MSYCQADEDRCMTKVDIQGDMFEFGCGKIESIDTAVYKDNDCSMNMDNTIETCICSQSGCNSPGTIC